MYETLSLSFIKKNKFVIEHAPMSGVLVSMMVGRGEVAEGENNEVALDVLVVLCISYIK